MIKHKAPSPIRYIIYTIALFAIGHWWFNLRRSDPSLAPLERPMASIPASPADRFVLPQRVPRGTVVDIDGSTSMVTINQNLKRAFERRFPGTVVETQANGSNPGIQTLLTGMVDVAALSRPLSAAEQGQGLRSVQVAQDAIAIVVGRNNPFQRTLTPQQVQAIFQGRIVNWAQLGGLNRPIRVINRPATSGTHQAFKDLVLRGGNFGTTPNITTLAQDATTPLFRALGQDGIGYATDIQVQTQQTVRALAIAGLRPEQATYPYRRQLYYAYQTPVNDVASAFLGFALSPQGKQAIAQEP